MLDVIRTVDERTMISNGIYILWVHRHRHCAVCMRAEACVWIKGLRSDLRQKSNVDKRTKRLHIENCGIKLPLTVCPLWLRISCRSGFRSTYTRTTQWVACMYVCASENIVRLQWMSATRQPSKIVFCLKGKMCSHLADGVIKLNFRISIGPMRIESRNG